MLTSQVRIVTEWALLPAFVTPSEDAVKCLTRVFTISHFGYRGVLLIPKHRLQSRIEFWPYFKMLAFIHFIAHFANTLSIFICFISILNSMFYIDRNFYWIWSSGFGVGIPDLPPSELLLRYWASAFRGCINIFSSFTSFRTSGALLLHDGRD